MKSIPCLLVSALIVLVAANGAPATTPAVPVFPDLTHDPLYDQLTYQRLRDITVNVSWDQVELGTALRDLTLMVRTTHPVHADINFRFSSSAAPAYRSRRISISLRGVPVYQVLESLSQQADFSIKVHPDLVLVVPRSARQGL